MQQGAEVEAILDGGDREVSVFHISWHRTEFAPWSVHCLANMKYRSPRRSDIDDWRLLLKLAILRK